MSRRWIQLGLAAAMIGLCSGCSSVVARVNGENITQKQFVEEMERQAGLKALQMTIFRQLVFDRAEAEGVMPTAEEITARFEAYKKERFGGDEQQMRQFMKANAVDDLDIQAEIKYELATFKLRTRELDPSDANLKQFFNEYKERYFDKPERVTFRQMVLPTKQAADEIIAQLNNDGAIFADLAKAYSLDEPSKANGGMYEGFPWNLIEQNAKPVHDALRKLAPNQITQQPVPFNNSQQGGQTFWFVLKLVEKLPAEPASFQDPETKELVKEQYLQSNAIPEEALLQDLVKNSDVVVLEPEYKAAIEPLFSAGGASGLSPELEKQLQEPVEMAPPTQVDESAMPATKPPTGDN